MRRKIMIFCNTRNIRVDDEYYSYVSEILENEKFKKLKKYNHHGIITRYEHSLDVSYMNYKICKHFNLDYISAARAGLLHDFFLNDVENKDIKDFFKCLHPQVALNNAMQVFELNDIEKDIIICHMWPLTLRLPKYKETYIITISDKICCINDLVKSLKLRMILNKIIINRMLL